MKSSDFGCPQRRLRRYFLLLDMDSFGLDQEAAVALAKKMLRQARELGCPPIALNKILLDTESQYVKAELERKQEATRDLKPVSSQWQNAHHAFLLGKGLSRQRILAALGNHDFSIDTMSHRCTNACRNRRSPKKTTTNHWAIEAWPLGFHRGLGWLCPSGFVLQFCSGAWS